LKISSREVEYVAHLARLEITDKEKEKFTAQINDILLYIDKLNELDTKGVEPMSHAIALTNAFREDKIRCPKSSTDDFGKSSYPEGHHGLLRCTATFVIATCEKSTPHSSGFARLVSEARCTLQGILQSRFKNIVRCYKGNYGVKSVNHSRIAGKN